MNHELSEELLKLIRAALEDRLDEAGCARLSEWLARDPWARRQYVQYVSTVAGVRRYLRGKPQFPFDVDPPDSGPENSPPALPVSMEAEGPLPVAPNDQPPSGQMPPVLGFVADAFGNSAGLLRHPFAIFAGAGLLALLVAFLMLRPAEAPRGGDSGSVAAIEAEPAPVFIARITDSHNAQWVDSGRSSDQSNLLAVGETVELAMGLMEIKFGNGAKVLLEGPAAFSLDSPSRATLKYGQLTAQVPQQAIGFTIRTPTVNVVDLGTEFGVRVSQKGLTDVAVFSGKVIAKPHVDEGNAAEGIAVLADEIRRFWQGSSADEEPLPAPQFTFSIPKSVQVDNASFESPSIGGWLAREVAGWTLVSNPAWAGPPLGGVQLKSLDRTQLPGTADGQQWAFLETRKMAEVGVHESSMHQAVGVLSPNTEYRLRVVVGRAIFTPKPNGRPSYPLASIQHLEIGLWAGPSKDAGPLEPLKVVRDPHLPFTAQRNSEEVNLLYRSPAELPSGEQVLFIRLAVSGDEWFRVLFDQVQLDVVSHGEPVSDAQPGTKEPADT